MEKSALADTATATQDLSAIVVPLLKGVLYREGDAAQWNGLVTLQARVRDYVAVLGLELILDEAEGYAFLRSRVIDDTDEFNLKLPRLVTRRPLSFPVSLLLALLRKKLAEFDASGDQNGEAMRLILSRGAMTEMIRVFLPDGSNEAKLVDQLETHINKVIELGFVRRLKPTQSQGSTQEPEYEVRRILKAFVDAQWLAEFDQRLAAYQAQLAGTVGATLDE